MRNCFIYIASDERLYEQVEGRGWLTDVLPSGVAAAAQVSVISWKGAQVDALAVLRTDARVANYKTRIAVRDVHELEEPVSPDELSAAIEEPLFAAISTALDSGGPLSPEATKALHDALTGLRPGLADVWQELERLADIGRAQLWSDDEEPIVAYERDAVGLALSLAGIERSEILRNWVDNPRAPFLQGLTQYHAREDAIIAHDAQVFGDWASLGPTVVGITQFQQGEHELTVVNANRTPIERTLGVDLLYYANDYDSYVFVQYKRLREESGAWEFRPSGDRNFEAELSRMRTISQPTVDDGNPRNHRFGENFCFIKLCKPTTKRAAVPSGELSAGMYLPLDYFDKLVSSGQLLGPRGGMVVRHDNVDRWLNNSSFIALVERAWVGTRGLTSSQISEVIRRALDADHSMVIAAGRTVRSRRGVP